MLTVIITVAWLLPMLGLVIGFATDSVRVMTVALVTSVALFSVAILVSLGHLWATVITMSGR
jgi:hypothetical protein